MIQFFSKLLSKEESDQSKAEEFICLLYGIKCNIKTVNEVIYVKLVQMTGKTKQVRGSLVMGTLLYC